ncbi:MAG: protoporphyrin/coproporphyrin ferrochelatase [Gaiellaceae bacterium]|nr:protoporphyrin/coproporphyrin ferrochelatase [Gaiellaceae bacterium]
MAEMATPVEERKQPADRAVARLPEHEFDAIVLVSFGGPEGMDDVMPFLENVTRGRNVPRERLLDVAHHYELFGGVSPINEQNRALIAALEPELRAHGVDLPVYFGNRNWHPYLTDTLRQMRDDGVRRALAVFTSAFSSYSGCRQYREDLFNAQAAVGPDAPEVPRVRMFFNHPGFIGANVDRVRAALAQVPAGAHVAFTAHSIPLAMAENCAYEAQLVETARLVATAVGVEDWAVVYQSRSGPPQVPWLEPDIGDHLETVAARGVAAVVVAPIGFVSDHLEVLFDLDVEAKEIAERLGLAFARAGTAGTHPAFVAGLRDLIVERLTPGADRPALGRFGPSHDVCAPDCCLPGSGRLSPWDAPGS